MSSSPAHPLRATARPSFEEGGRRLRVVDLFCGCGGLTLGLAQAAHAAGYGIDIPLAVDLVDAPLAVYQANFPMATTRAGDVAALFPGAPRAKLTNAERLLRSEVGDVSVLTGGPPCQGHSDLNNHTRRKDPKNELYVCMLRAAEVLLPAMVMIENVPTVVHAEGDVVAQVREGLGNAYEVADQVVQLVDLGIPQRRRRHVLLAIKRELDRKPQDVFDELVGGAERHDLRWAIEDLTAADPTGIDAPPTARKVNVERMQWMIDNKAYDLPNDRRPPCHQNDHSYKSMYGRLKWDQPAQTITSGFGSIGQGRYMHPDFPRALTPHEAARIQGFPDYFDFTAATRRADLADIIGNAVPPALSEAIVSPLIQALTKS